MKIAGIACAFPPRQVSNQDILQIVRESSEAGFEGDLDQTLQHIEYYLNYIGIKHRRWLGDNDNAFDYTEQAVNEALDRAQLERSDIDLLIHASVDKRVLEPGMSFFIAKALGMDNVQCFDITEACGSWTRATQIAQMYLEAGTHCNVMIVTSEYTQHEGQLISFALKNPAEVEWAFAGYTVGEGSTATVLTRDDSTRWQYTNRSFTQLVDLCMCPIYDYDPQLMQMGDVSLAGEGSFRFSSYGKKMQDQTLHHVVEMMRNNVIPVEDVDLFIPHTQTLTAWKEIEETLGKKINYQFLLPEYGNLVNNSIPSGIALAEQEGRLKRGDTVAAMMTAAGMSFTLYNFVY
ncbi:MAG: 3-oxoacyl-[acyl-carrier-protein] synthase III C-terminal domain-containing protein [Oleibacter sp.]|nr:3-oxoacyl-[acyl-carrier-protein] synthase III C-terminal domain-containing protein [Thalassolituus sp.]